MPPKKTEAQPEDTATSRPPTAPDLEPIAPADDSPREENQYPAAIRAILEQVKDQVKPIILAMRMTDFEIVIVFASGHKLKFDASPGPDGKYIQILPR